MTIRPRGKSYQVDVKVAAKDNPTGKVVRVRSTSPDETTAKRLEAEIKTAIMQHGCWKPNTASAPTRSQGTLAAALQETWTYPSGRRRGWKYQRSGLLQYNKADECIQFLGASRHCATITTEDFDNLTIHFEKKGNGTDTIAAKIQALRRVLWHAERKGWITHRPLWDRPAPGQPREFLFDQDLEQRVITYFQTVERDVFTAALFILGIETGLRLGELLLSTCNDWDLDKGMVLVRAEISKSGVARVVTLTDRAKKAVKPWLEAFDNVHNARPFPVKLDLIGRRMRKARTYLGYGDNPHFCFHATRHTRATRLAHATRDPFIVMNQLGHADIKTSMRYIKMAGIDLTRIEGHKAFM